MIRAPYTDPTPVFDREAVIEQAAKAIGTGQMFIASQADRDWYTKELASRALPVIAKPLLAPLREMHKRYDILLSVRSRRPVDICVECSHPYPCQTVRLLDALEAAAGVDR